MHTFLVTYSLGPRKKQAVRFHNFSVSCPIWVLYICNCSGSSAKEVSSSCARSHNRMTCSAVSIDCKHPIMQTHYRPHGPAQWHAQWTSASRRQTGKHPQSSHALSLAQPELKNDSHRNCRAAHCRARPCRRQHAAHRRMSSSAPACMPYHKAWDYPLTYEKSLLSNSYQRRTKLLIECLATKKPLCIWVDRHSPFQPQQGITHAQRHTQPTAAAKGNSCTPVTQRTDLLNSRGAPGRSPTPCSLRLQPLLYNIVRDSCDGLHLHALQHKTLARTLGQALGHRRLLCAPTNNLQLQSSAHTCSVRQRCTQQVAAFCTCEFHEAPYSHLWL